MKKYIIYIGLNDQHTRRQEVNTLDAYKIATNVFATHTGGATITEARGVYTHDDGQIITESTLRCEVFGADLESIERAVTILKDAFNQESVAVEEADVKSYFK